MKRRGLIGALIILALVITTLSLTGCMGNTVTISFNSMEGSAVTPIKVTAETTTLELPTPTRTGYVFEYWCYDFACTEMVDVTSIPTENVTFYAKWTQQFITVTFIADGNKQYRFVPYGEGLAKSAMPEVPAKEGYVGRWLTGDLTDVRTPVTITAEYVLDTYSVVYMVEGTPYFSDRGSRGDSVELPDDPVIDGAVFVGWYSDENYTERVAPVETIATSSVTLYARMVYIADMPRYFTYEVSSGKATITALTAAGRSQTVLIIPEELGGYPVTKIGGGETFAMISSSVLETLYIPSCVEEIADYAFLGDVNLSDVVIKEGLKSIGDCAFAGCESLSDVVLPASLTSIGDFAFAGIREVAQGDVTLPGDSPVTNKHWTAVDSSLTSVTFAPNSRLASLGEYVFFKSALTEFTIPDSADYVADHLSFAESEIDTLLSDCAKYPAVDNALYSQDGASVVLIAPKCTDLTLKEDATTIAPYSFFASSINSISIPATVTSIGTHAFDSCALTSIEFEDGSLLATIGEYAFLSSALRNVTLPSSVTTIGVGAFKKTALAYVNLSGTDISEINASVFEDCADLMTVTLGSLTSIGDYAFYNCRKLSTVSFPQVRLESIGNYAFADCLSLKTVTIPSVTTFGNYAFAGISGKSTAVVDISRATVNIGDYAFMNTATTVYNPNTTSLRTMGVGAFKNCTSLSRANISQSAYITALPDETFYGCSRLNNVTVNANIRTLGARAFYGCTNLTSVNFKTDALGNGVTEIKESCFENCTSLGSAGGEPRILPLTLTTLGDRAFYNCSSLDEITLPVNLLTVAAEAFAYCTSLTNIYYDTNCLTDTLEENCFAYCTALTSVTLPKNLSARSASSGAIKNPFLGCSSLTSFNVLSGSVLTAVDGVVYIPYGGNRKIYLYPTGKTGEFEVDTNVVAIDDYAFFGSHVESVTFLANPILEGKEEIYFVEIGSYAFAESSLTSAILTNRIKSVGDYAFAGSNLASLYVDGTIITYSDTAYTIQNGYADNLLSIGERAFSNTKITSLSLPARVQSLDVGAFAECYSLSTLELEDTDRAGLTLTIGNYAFFNDVSLRNLSFPVQITEIGDYAFADCHNVASIAFDDASTVIIGKYAFMSNHYLYSVSLPASLVSMDEGIFADCSRLTDVTLSNVAIPIPDYAFYGCFALREFSVPSAVTAIGEYAFSGTHINKVTFNAGSADLTIGKFAFSETPLLTSVTFPDNLKLIDEYAFYQSALQTFEYGNAVFTVKDCAFYQSALREVVLNNNVTLDGDYIFADTAELESVITECSIISAYAFSGSSVREVTFVDLDEIADSAFADTYSLEEVFIDFDKPIVIGEYAFNFSGVSTVEIHASSLNIGNMAFASSYNLASVDIDADEYSFDNYAFAFSELSSINLTGYAVSLGTGFAIDCPNLTSIDVTSEHNEYYSVDGVVYYDDGADVTLLQYPAGKTGSVFDLDPSVTVISGYAFSGNPYLSALTIRSNDTVSADYDAFDSTRSDLTVFVAQAKKTDYESAENFDVAVSVISESIGEFVLTLIIGDKYSVTGYTGTATDVTVNGIISDGTKTYRIESVGKNAFRNNEKILSVTIGNGIKDISDYAFAGCSALTSVTLGNNVASVGAHAFDECVSLSTVSLDNEITAIGDYAFANCVSLSTITLPAKLRNIGSYAFKGDVGLTDVFIPSLVELGDCAFDGASGLVSLVLPQNIKSIGSFAFRGCKNLSYLYVDSDYVVKLHGTSSLAGTYSGLKILVAEKLVSEYCSDSAWRNFADGILSADRISGNYLLADVGNGNYRLDAYLGTETNVEITYADTHISEIGKYAFGRFCSSVTLSGIQTVDDYAFIHAVNLTSVSMPGVVTIGNYAFASLSLLSSVDFGNDLVSIGTGCFSDCFRLETVTFPYKLAYIGDYAFSCAYSNMKLKNVTFNGTASTSLRIGQYAFADNDELETLTFNCFVNYIGDYAFSNCKSLSSIYLNHRGSGAAAVDESSTHVFENCNLLSIFVPTLEKRREYLQTWYNIFDKNRLLLTYYVADDYDDNNVTIVQDNFVIKPIGESGSVAAIVNYLGTETEITFPSLIVVENGTNRTEYQIERLGRDDNNSSTEHNGRIIGDNVTRVVIPSSVKYISGDAFRGAKSLREVSCENNSLLVTIGNYAFADCPRLTSISLPKTVISVGNYAFSNDVSLTSFTVENFLNAEIDKTSLNIGAYAFDHCSGLVEITMPKHLASIGTYAFNYATGLNTVIFPSDCTISAIESYAFARSGLTTISLPAALANVGNYAFAYCSALKSVYLSRTTANYSSITTTYENVFYQVRSSFVKVYVPETMYTQYGNAIGWSTKTVVPNLVSGEYNYRRSTSTVILTGYLGSDKIITIPASLTINGTLFRVTTISSYFGNDTIEEVYFASGSSVSTLDRYAFAGCSALRKVHLPDTIQSIGENAFQNCSSLYDVTLSNGIDKIPAYAFDGCSNLKEITLPASVKEIGNAAFQNCSSLYRIVIEFSTASNNLGISALAGTSPSLVLIVPENRRDSFANQWSDYKDIIFDKKQLMGDFVVSDDGQGGYALAQYCGRLDIDLTDKTFNGRKITSINDNAIIYDVTITGID